MKTIASITFLIAAASTALVSTARAQIETFNTIADYNDPSLGSSSIHGFNTGTALTQTFSDVSEITTMTYQFLEKSTPVGINAGDNITAYFVQWTPGGGDSSGEAASSTALFSESFNVPEVGSAGWATDEYADDSGTYQGYNVTLSIDQFLNPSDTYAVILVDTSSTGTIGLMSLENNNNSPDEADSGDAFNLGNDYSKNGVTNGLTQLSSGSSNFAGGDWGFEQLDVVPGGNNLVPVPEPKQAAAALAALFVAVLVGSRLYSRRQEQVLVGMPA
jgi:hypothetical protein